MVAQKERAATAVRAAVRCAEKDPTKLSEVADAESARDKARAAALAAPVELDLPAVTVGSKMTRSSHVQMCQHQQAAARKAAAEAALDDAILKRERFKSIYEDNKCTNPSNRRSWIENGRDLDRWVAAANAAVAAEVEWEAAKDACEAAHARFIEGLEADVAEAEAELTEAEAELTEARAYRQRVMEKAALDALIRHYQEAEGAAGSSH